MSPVRAAACRRLISAGLTTVGKCTLSALCAPALARSSMASPLEYDPEQPGLILPVTPLTHVLANAPYPAAHGMFPPQPTVQQPWQSQASIVRSSVAQHESQLRPQQQYARGHAPCAPPMSYPTTVPSPPTFSSTHQLSSQQVERSSLPPAPPTHASSMHVDPIIPEPQRHYANAIFTPGISSFHHATDDRSAPLEEGAGAKQEEHRAPPHHTSTIMRADSRQRHPPTVPIPYQHLSQPVAKPAQVPPRHQSMGPLPTPQTQGPSPAKDPRRPRSEISKPKDISLQDELDMLFVTADNRPQSYDISLLLL